MFFFYLFTNTIQTATKYEQDDLVGCKAQCDRCLTDDPDVVVAQACIAFKEVKYDEARGHFTEAMNTLGYQPDIAYNIALCHYQLKQYGPALKHIAEIIERGVREHPELSVGSSADGIDVRSVGNSQVLRETALVEAVRFFFFFFFFSFFFFGFSAKKYDYHQNYAVKI